jgi:hypothetical protein
MEQTINLYSETDAYGGSRHVWLRLTEEGKLILEGQDLGGAATKAFGAGEYEWAWSLAPEQVVAFLKTLGVGESQSKDVLGSVAAALGKIERTKIQNLFRDAGAKFWSRIGD